MRLRLFTAAAFGMSAAVAQPPSPDVEGDTRRVVELNHAIQAHNDVIAASNAAAKFTYARERADYEAALARNGQERAQAEAAARAYEAARADQAAALARWQQQVAAIRGRAARGATEPAASPGAAQAPARLVCHDVPRIGSLAATDRICRPARDWNDEHLRRQDRVGSCQRIVCH